MATRSTIQKPLTNTLLDGIIQGEKWDISSNNTISIQMANYISYFDASYNTYIPNSSLLYAVLNYVTSDISRYLPINFSVSNTVISDPIYSTANITFTAINMAGPDAYYAGATTNTLGVAEFPGSNTTGDIYIPNAGVDIFLNKLILSNSYLAPGQDGIYTIYHELGHALGLKHPFDDGGNGRPTFASLGIAPYDFGVITVMSYENPANYTSDGYGAPTTYMAADILALQEIYGKRSDYNTENTTYSLSNTDAWGSLYDCGGADTLNFSACTQGFLIALDGGVSYSSDFKTGYWLLSQNSSIRNLENDLESSYEDVIGTNYADEIYGNSLNNSLNAGLGNDSIYSSAGNDAIDGGGDNDTCIYNLTRSSYTITYSSGTYTVTALSGNEGSDTFINIEYFQFSDQTVAISNLNRVPTGSISIAGDLIEGRTLTAQNNFQDEDGIVGGIDYWWYVTSDGGRTGITDTASSSYVLKSSDIGKKILVQAVYTDGLGNTASVYSELVGVGPVLDDSSNPIPIIFTPFDASNNVAVGSNIVVTFSEAIKFGSGNIEIHQGSANGTLFASYSVSSPGFNLNISDTVLTINPTNNLAENTNYYVTFANGSIQDLSGNNFSGITTYDFITQETTPPTIAISTNDSALKAGETATISFTLSEASTDFTSADVTVSGGALTNFTGSGTNYSATFTPTSNSITNGVVSVSSTKFTDAAGNNNTASNSLSMSVDTIPNRSPSGLVKIAGTATQKLVLTASNTLADADGLGAITYQWLADNVAISDATASTYTLTQSEVGKIIKVAASYVDGRGQSEIVTSAIPTKAVANVNDAPTLVNAISDKSATEGTAFSFTVPSNTFSDIDTGDTLTLSAKLASGAALPKWLKFTSGAFIGTPLDADSATSITVRVTGTDKAKGTAYDDFVLDITGVNVAPTAKAITKVATATEGKAFKFALPKGTFTDGDKNDVLTYSATSKPDWLSIDSAGNLTGTPNYAAADSSTTSVVFVATDRLGLTATTTLTIKLTNTATIKGTANSETIVAGAGADKITGLAGNDTITGGADNDTISGGAGNDTLTGGSGNDYFLFDTAANASSNLDTITDFVSGADKFQFSKKVFAGLGKAVGNLTEAQFAYSTESLTTTDRIVYNSSTGALYYDADGSGTTASAVQVALIGGHPTVAVTDFLIV
jgi:Ca2+-binding RTX toxin-like protein